MHRDVGEWRHGGGRIVARKFSTGGLVIVMPMPGRLCHCMLPSTF